MKKKIRSRLEFFLAKIAGVEADIETITPSVASDTVEELLDAIAERVDKASELPPDATKTKAGIVKMAANVPGAAGSAPTAEEFKALIDALIAAGIMAAPDASQG